MSTHRHGLCILLVTLAVVAAGCGRPDGTTSPVQTPTTPTPPPGPEPPAPPTPGPQPCSFSLTADTDDFGPDGGNTTLRITTAAGCAWSVRIDAAWLSVEGASSGEGPAAVKLLAQRNDTPATRRATVAVTDASLAFTQDARAATACNYEVAPVAFTLPRDAWTSEVSIKTSPDCAWTATSTAPWLRLRTSGGTGSGALAFDAEFNPQTRYAETRVGVIEVRWNTATAGQNVRVVQWGDCTTTATPATGGLPAGTTYSGTSTAGTLTVGAAGGRVHFWVLTDPFRGCAWTAESGDAWITWTSPGLHQIAFGDGDLVFTVPAKAATATRSAIVTLGGRFRLTIVQ